MKALTLWQPWALLVVAGHKRFETRSWKTNHRGVLAIHAAKREPPWVRAIMTPPHSSDAAKLIWRIIRRLGFTRFDQLPRGAVLGTVWLDAIFATGSRAFTLQSQTPSPCPVVITEVIST